MLPVFPVLLQIAPWALSHEAVYAVGHFDKHIFALAGVVYHSFPAVAQVSEVFAVLSSVLISTSAPIGVLSP